MQEAWPDSQAPVPPGSPPSTQAPVCLMAGLVGGTGTKFLLDLLSPVAPVFPMGTFAVGEALSCPPIDPPLDYPICSSKSAEHRNSSLSRSGSIRSTIGIGNLKPIVPALGEGRTVGSW